MELFKVTKTYDFLGKRHYAYAISIITLALAIGTAHDAVPHAPARAQTTNAAPEVRRGVHFAISDQMLSER